MPAWVSKWYAAQLSEALTGRDTETTGSLWKPTMRSFLGEEGLEWMTVGMVVRREGILVVVGEFFRMERGREAVVTLLPRMDGMVAVAVTP